MCTLAVAFQTDRRWPLVVAANRDERLGRPSEGWAIREGAEGRRQLAPRDLLAGGTWIGISAEGTFAGLTNFHAGPPDPRRRSRGELVPLALAAPSAEVARGRLAVLDASGWNPFHLLVADRETAFLWWFDGESSGLEPLAPGLHVVTERSPHGLCPRGERLRARWPTDPGVPALHALLSVHQDQAAEAEATCIHIEPHYGTRSSAILRLAPTLGLSELYVTDAAPCLAPHEDRSVLLGHLRAPGHADERAP